MLNSKRDGRIGAGLEHSGGLPNCGVVLFVGALISIARNRTYSSGGTVVWALLVLALPVLGPVLWFLIGRKAPKSSRINQRGAH